MSSSFYDDYDNRFLPEGSENTEETEENTEPEVEKNDEMDEYYELPTEIKSRTLIWSVLSFALGVLSIALCPLYYISLAFAVGSIFTSSVSRRNLGFFEKYAIYGLILGIMGIVFGISAAIAIKLEMFN